MYAFWRNDRYPNVLGGLVTNTRENGSVEIKGYGVGHYFTPSLGFLNDERGAKLLEDLKVLEAECMAEEKALREKYRLRLVKRLAQDKIVHPNEYVAYPNEQAKALVSARIAAERAQEEAMKAHR